MMKEQTIYYTNSVPGSGKTRWAINYIQKYLKSNDTSKTSLIIYCAPTKALLKEVYTSLTADASIDKDKVFLFTSDDYKYISQIIKNSYKVYESVKNSQDNIDIQKIDKDFLFRFTKQIALVPGSVLLITHEAFWNSSFSKDNETFKDKEHTVLIIDEARDCYIKTVNFRISVEHSEQFEKYLGVKNESKFILIDPQKLSRKKLEEAGFRSYMFNGHKDILDELDTISLKSNVNVYIYFVFDEAISSYSISVVRAPYDALYGWKKVIALAAFYESSQMYHLIKASNTNPLIEYNFKQVDVTHKIINAEHLKKLKERFKNTDISWIYANSASMTKYKNYVSYVYNNIFDKDKLSTLLKRSYKYLKKEVAKQTIPIPVTKQAFVNFLKYKKAKDLTPSNYLDDTIFKDKYHKQHIAPCSPTAFATLYSYNIIKKWMYLHSKKDYQKYLDTSIYEEDYDDGVVEEETLSYEEFCEKSIDYLLSVNVYSPHSDYFAYKSYMDKSAQDVPLDKSFETSKLSKKSNWVINVPKFIQDKATAVVGDTRGINTYKDYNKMVVISSYIVQPVLKTWFNSQCPDYDPDEDFTLGQTIQVMMRCSIRNVQSTDRVLIILNSKNLAKDVRSKLFNLPTLLEPSSLGLSNTVLINPLLKDFDLVFSNSISTTEKEKLAEKARIRMIRYRKGSGYILNKIRNLESEELLYRDLYVNDKALDAITNVETTRNKLKYAKRKNEYTLIQYYAQELKEYNQVLRFQKKKYRDEFIQIWATNKSSIIQIYKDAAKTEHAKRLEKIEQLRQQLKRK